MKILKTIQHNEKLYNIVMESKSGGDFVIYASFEDGRRANGYSHHISLMTLFDMSKKFGMDIVINDMIETVEDEIKRNLWEKYVEFLNKKNSNKI